MNKEEKTRLRTDLFRHLDGIVTAPTAYALLQSGVLDHLLTHKSTSLQQLTRVLKANEGYLNVALRVLSSQGWLQKILAKLLLRLMMPRMVCLINTL